MTALDPSSADRVLAIPDASSTVNFNYGDVALARIDSAPHVIVESAHGFPAIPRGSLASGETLAADGPVVATGDYLVVMVFEGLDQLASSAYPSTYGGPTTLVFGTDSIASIVASGNNLPGGPWPSSLPAGQVAIAVALSDGEVIAATSVHGVVGTAEALQGPSGGPVMLDPDGGGNAALLLGMWMWDDLTVSAGDIVDTAVALADLFGGDDPDPEPSGPSTVGSAYRAAVVQAIFGPAASGVVPAVLWGAWLDDELNVLATTGVEVPQAAFGPTPTGVANIAIIDGGVCPSTVPTSFALLDAEAGGQVVAYAPVTFGTEPEPGDPIAFAPGTLVFNYGA